MLSRTLVAPAYLYDRWLRAQAAALPLRQTSETMAVVATRQRHRRRAFASRWCIRYASDMPESTRRRSVSRSDFVVATDPGRSAISHKAAVALPDEHPHEDRVALPPLAEPTRLAVGATPHLYGVSHATLQTILPILRKRVPVAVYAMLADIAEHCHSVSRSECITYARARGIDLDALLTNRAAW